MALSKTVQIAPDVLMPTIGLGTWQMKDKDVLYTILDEGLRCGYRLIDTAARYNNEHIIGEALTTLLPKHGLERRDIFITSKLSTADHGSGTAYRACLKSLENLRTDYLDLFIIHFPGADGVDSRDPRLKELRKGSWLDMEKMKSEGKFRAIGVSNYLVRHLEELRQYATIWPPAVNQCEFHPYYKSTDLVEYCRQNGIHFQAYTSLGGTQKGHTLTNNQVVKEMAIKYECSPCQLLLAWALNQGISVLPKTTNPTHVAANYGSLDIMIKKEDMDRLSNLGIVQKYAWDPEAVL